MVSQTLSCTLSDEVHALAISGPYKENQQSLSMKMPHCHTMSLKYEALQHCGKFLDYHLFWSFERWMLKLVLACHILCNIGVNMLLDFYFFCRVDELLDELRTDTTSDGLEYIIFFKGLT
jgi:hypothetical protein